MTVALLQGDALSVLRGLPENHFHAVVTSPPYFNLRSYLPVDDPQKHLEMGQEASPAAYVAAMVGVFEEVRRVLRPDGLCWVNIADSYAGSWGAEGRRETPRRPSWRNSIANHPKVARSARVGRECGIKPKDLMLIPARLSIALQEAGWWVRRDVVWNKLNPMPESVEDRPTSAHEYLFMLAKSESYFYDAWPVREERTSDEDSASFRGGSYTGSRQDNTLLGQREVRGNARVADTQREARSVWSGASEPFSARGVLGKGAAKEFEHFATMPGWLVEKALRCSTSERGACPACGAAWRRIIERQRFRDGRPLGGAWAKPTDARRLGATGVGHWRDTTVKRHVGWERSCGCAEAPPVRCRVLDPFLGAGTTALVADRLQLDCTGIDLNARYVHLARERLRSDAGLLMEVG
jgi:DNA modification methylase